MVNEQNAVVGTATEEDCPICGRRSVSEKDEHRGRMVAFIAGVTGPGSGLKPSEVLCAEHMRLYQEVASALIAVGACEAVGSKRPA